MTPETPTRDDHAAATSTGPSTPADLLVARIQAEHERTGRVDRDRVLAIAERRQTNPMVLREVLSLLESRGILRAKRSEEVEGWTPPNDGDEESHFAVDLLGTYLREIGERPLLMAHDERTLGRRIRAGRSFVIAMLTDEAWMTHESAEQFASHFFLRRFAQELEVDRPARTLLADAADAEDRLYQCNLRLVVSVARQTAWNHPKLDQLDMVQAGNEGLVKAVQKFDHTLGYKFSTYATWWIRQAVTRFVANSGRTIRLPVHVVEKINRIRRAKRELLVELKRDSTLPELSEWCDLDPAEVQFLMDISATTSSLNKPIGVGETTLGEVIADRSPPVEYESEVAELATIVESILHELTEREQEIVRQRFGINDGRPRTLEEIGTHFGLTRERIRQIEAKILEKLRVPHRSARLKEFY
jgi:RNA polymerase sigma factor (sigma-70 family)